MADEYQPVYPFWQLLIRFRKKSTRKYTVNTVCKLKQFFSSSFFFDKNVIKYKYIKKEIRPTDKKKRAISCQVHIF